jgi:hypothetical protein
MYVTSFRDGCFLVLVSFLALSKAAVPFNEILNQSPLSGDTELYRIKSIILVDIRPQKKDAKLTFRKKEK